MSDANFDVIIIGGSYAGLSAAMALGRSLRKVLIIDSGMPCNRQTPRSHNFITQDGAKPTEIAAKALAQVMKYNTVQFLNDLAISGQKTDNGFFIKTESGKDLKANKLIFATGIHDLMPNIKGFADCWGISVVHCPYCHGYEIRHKKTGILANGEKALHYAGLVNNLTDDLTILTSGKAEFDEEQLAKLNKHSNSVVEKEIVEVEHENGFIGNLIFKDGSILALEAIYAGLPFEQHSQIPSDLGCEITEAGFIKVDIMQKTTVEGVYACGDNSSGMRSVANAVATGNVAGAVVNKDLVDDQF
ncbi:NAD(P)/FAD-dependent oxidoreductase [Fulvivirga lutimaris]|uniref:NAD(P)/FAD-dependent oxidoreductase n=1 Tax=Fulvivirga lutimaris TaxID=1819566 RepID=UPI0012BC5FCD|nr:NAD(P)/FAD-dependent oxidoreductase [Fulvivirga lutimaris]MTI39636.1 NAD(P)/FAD-dependent oxidoreductase [Fulvivirga lutimaris]